MTPPVRFTCNLCGSNSVFEVDGSYRESASCQVCQSNVRFRELMYHLFVRLTGAPGILARCKTFPYSGIGLTDSPRYADRLSRLTRRKYQNTYYHQEPRLDICDPGERWLESADFLIASDVFEHVPPPVQRAFDGAAAVLKPGGVLLLTVPFGYSPTVEHFPDLRDFAVVELGGERLLVNRTGPGDYSIRNDLVFHYGQGATLEMRVFGYQDIVDHLEAAGFRDIRVHAEDVPEFGIFHDDAFSLPITAIAP